MQSPRDVADGYEGHAIGGAVTESFPPTDCITNADAIAHTRASTRARAGSGARAVTDASSNAVTDPCSNTVADACSDPIANAHADSYTYSYSCARSNAGTNSAAVSRSLASARADADIDQPGVWRARHDGWRHVERQWLRYKRDDRRGGRRWCNGEQRRREQLLRFDRELCHRRNDGNWRTSRDGDDRRRHERLGELHD